MESEDANYLFLKKFLLSTRHRPSDTPPGLDQQRPVKPGPTRAAILRLSPPQFPLLRVVCYSQRFTKCLPEGHFLFWYIGFLSASHHPIQEACFSSPFRAPNSCGYLV